MTQRFQAGSLVVIVGACVLLISLFLEWFEPSVDAWTAFEMIDLVLAFLALGAIAAALGFIDRVTPGKPLSVIAASALILVVFTMVNPPPPVFDSELASGPWVALIGVVVMGLGTFLIRSQLSFSITMARDSEQSSRDTQPQVPDEPPRVP